VSDLIKSAVRTAEFAAKPFTMIFSRPHSGLCWAAGGMPALRCWGYFHSSA